MIILGISALYHDSAACLVIDGEIVAAAQEERFTRIKHDFNIPVNAIRYCLEEGNITGREIGQIVFYDHPLLTLDRYIKNILAAGKDSRDVIERGYQSMFSKKMWIHNELRNLLDTEAQIMVCEHHVSHAASAFYPSPFENAVIITMDGVGEWATTTIGVGNGKSLSIKEEIRFPHSLGLLYSAFTYFCGFKVNSGDYKLMGLAPYGEPVYEDLIFKHLIDVKEDGSFHLNLEYFDFQYGRAMTNEKFAKLFGGKRREPESKITKREMDIAASAQKVVEVVMLKIVEHARKEYGKNIDNLVLAGGVALNCVANGKIKNSGIFHNIWIQPAAGDAGGSLGAALYAYYCHEGVKRKINDMDSQKGSSLGPFYSESYMKKFVESNKIQYHIYPKDVLFDKIAEELENGMVIGLFQGRMEFGPRALGNRSIIADPRSGNMQSKLNLKIKYRESFRPFAPAVLLEDVSKYFELEEESPYMLFVENVQKSRCCKTHIQSELSRYDDDMLKIVKQKRSDIPAVTHVDYSARIQTVSQERNQYFYSVIKAFQKKTGCGVVINTSFNVRGEPIVCTPKDAYACFMRTEMDILVLENIILYKKEQPEWQEDENWHQKYELD